MVDRSWCPVVNLFHVDNNKLVIVKKDEVQRWK